MVMCCSPKTPRSKILRQSAVAVVLFAATTAAYSSAPDAGAVTSAELSSQRLMQAVKALSQFNGRQSGTSDGQKAAEYIAGQFGTPTLQSFPIKTNRVRSVQARIRIGDDMQLLQEGTDYLPIINGASGHIEFARVLFVGYGSAAEYGDLSTSGKVVLFLRGQPKSSPGRLSHVEKVRAAHAHGAVGYVTVTGPVLSAYEQRRGMTQAPVALHDTESSVGLPGLWVTSDVAQRLLQGTGLTLEAFQQARDSGNPTPPIDTGNTLGLDLVQQEIASTTANVLAYLPGSDPALLNETIVLGVHYDHFGTQGSLVFPGADDNASGTAVMLEVARVLFSSETKPRRGILFIAFAGEELGLLGSKYYVANPVRPLKGTKAMINVDHAGVGNGKITVGLSQMDKTAVQAAATSAGLTDKLELFGFFPGGDHVPFVEAGIPTATIVSSGPHPDFHRPSDVPEKLTPEILMSVAQYTLALLRTLANAAP